MSDFDKDFPKKGGPLSQADQDFPRRGALNLQTGIKDTVLRGLAHSDEFFEYARGQQRQRMLPPGVEGSGTWLETAVDALNPVPGNTAEALALGITAPIKGNLIMGPLKRILAAGATGATVRGAQGEDPWEAGKRFAVGQAFGEGPGLVAGGILKQRQLSRAAKDVAAKKKLNETITEQGTKYDKRGHEVSQAQAKAAHDAQLKAYKTAKDQADISYEAAVKETKAREAEINTAATNNAKILDAQDLIVWRANKERLKADFLKAQQAQAEALKNQQRAHAQHGAAEIMEFAKRENPAWADLPSNELGLLDAVNGQGPALASARYEASFRAAMERAKGQKITLSPDDALALGLKLPPMQPATKPQVPAPSWLGGKLPPVFQGSAGGQSLEFAADEVMKAMQGKSGLKTTRQAYRNAANALDAADIGDPVARGEYKAAMGMIDQVKKTKSIEDGVYHPDRMRKGLTTNVVDPLRGRGLGDAIRGPVAETTVGIPQKQGPLTPPVMPDKPLPRQVQPQTLREPAPGVYPPEPPPFQESPAPQPRTPLPDPQLPEGFQTVNIPVPQWAQRHPVVASGLASGAGGSLGMDPSNARLGLLAALTLGNKPFALRAPQSTLGALGERGLFSLLGSAVRGNLGEHLPDPEPPSGMEIRYDRDTGRTR
jgi:hypothetical protein